MSIINKLFPWIDKQPRTSYGFSYGGTIPPERQAEGFLRAYGEIGWLFAAVSKIAVGCSGVKWRLFQGDERSERSGIAKHPILTTLDKFNPFQTGAEGIELTQIYLDLIGECFWILNYNGLGEPAEIWIPYPHKMSVVPDKQKFLKGYVYGSGQEAIPFDLTEIIHFKYPNPLNHYRGLGPAQAMAVDLDTEQYAGEWNRNFFFNSARPDGVIEFDYKLSDEQFDRLKKQWSEKYKGVSKAHQVGLLEGGGKYKQIQVSQKDMDFRALRMMNRDNILGVLGMPLSVMGITENVNKANAEAGDYTFARWIEKPRLDRIKNKLNEQFVPLFRRSENLELDYDEVVPETIEQKMQLAESGIRAGYLTINEARKLRGLDPLKPDMGDVLLVPLNLIPTPISGKPIMPEKPVEEPKPEAEVSEGANPKGKGGVDIIIDDSFLRLKEEFEKELAKRKSESKSLTPSNSMGLTPDLKRAHWERYAQKTERQETAFKRVFDDVFEGQKKFVVGEYQRTGQLPDGLNDKETAQKFQPVIELVYDSAFEDAVAGKTAKQIDEFARSWIAERALKLAKSINITTMESIRHELTIGFEAGESISQLTKRIEGYFEDSARMRAERISRTEVISASNEGALHRYELSNIGKVEWLANPASCEKCLDEDGRVYDVIDSHGMIPKHPNCTCTWIANLD